MKVARSKVIAVFVALGMPQAGDWNKKRMQAKVNDLPNHVDPDFTLDDEELNDTLQEMLANVDSDEGVSVFNDEDAPPEEPKAEAEPEKETKKKPKAEDAPTKEAEPKASENGSLAGVRDSRSRGYLCGVVLQKHGLEKGVTDEMVAELDVLFGKPNPKESRFHLAAAWHALNGYTNPEKHAAK